MELIFLGTGSMIPTKERNHQSLLVRCKNYDILVDCGEGTQRQLRMMKIPPTRIRKVLISHWHGDHTLGLPGLIQTLGASNYEGVLEIYGPKGTKKHMNAMKKAFVYEQRLEISIKEVGTKKIFEDKDIIIASAELDHGIPCIGFSIKEQDYRRIDLKYVKKLGIPEGPLLGKLQAGKPITWQGRQVKPKDATYIVKGRKVAYVVDTELCRNCIKLAQDADVLVCESTFASEHEEKAFDYKHLTAKQAAQIANQANVKQLVLTHFSQRYKSMDEIEQEAKTYFENTRLAYDFMKMKV
jgi:ribonuclease Z